MVEFYIGLVFVIIVGLAFGSFLTCLTYRSPRGMTFFKGRSFCPKCKKEIAWYDNIPVVSYLVLRGKCRHCKLRISVRYPLIEISTAFLFAVFYFLYTNCNLGFSFCSWRGFLGNLALPFLLFHLVLIMAIFIIDLENTLIPDEIVFLGFIVAFIAFFLDGGDLYTRLLSSFLASSFLLFLNLVTRGRGMGLGDVKFALYGGLFFNFQTMMTWLFGAFLIGAVVGVSLLLLKKARFGARIPFGPFLAASLVLTLIFGDAIRFFPKL
ncbi:prepilin peptidase [Candidatus Woesebacteria bacterium]|nr:prepilin peptidase [Candidatus Woesebacteria bacterium]